MSGIDNMSAELLRTASDTSIRILHLILTKMWNAEKFAQQWNEGLIIKATVTIIVISTCLMWQAKYSRKFYIIDYRFYVDQINSLRLIVATNQREIS